MRRLLPLLLVLMPPALAAQPATPPVAAQKPHQHVNFGVVRDDPYFWLRERENPEVIAYLTAENAYTEAMTAPIKPLQETLYHEIIGRIKQDDSSAPVYDHGYWYYSRFEEGANYPLYARRRGTMDAPEEVLIDANARGAGLPYYAVGAFEVSEDGQMLAWAEDTVGRRLYTIRVKNLATGELLPDALYPATPSLAWAADGQTLFFARQDVNTLRSYQIVRHTLGHPAEHDAVVFQEDDEEFSVYVDLSKSHRFLLITSDQTLTTEARFLDARTPMGDWRVFRPRARGHEYSVEHAGDAWYIRSNQHGAENFALYRAPTEAPEAWRTLVPHRAEAYLEGFDVFDGFFVTQEREGGLARLRVRHGDGTLDHEVDFGEPTYAAALGSNPTYATPVVRYTYSSMTTPNTAYDYDVRSHAQTLVKRDPVLGSFDPARYVTERLMVTARDGTPIPVSLVRLRTTPVDGTAPLLLYAYGSYGYALSASFSHARLSLLDRGFVYAIAHIRGGQEMGRAWYETGKLMHKMNTFTDFIDAGEALVAQRYADPRKLYAQGGSRRGPAHGRRRQPPPRPLERRHRRRAVCGRRHDDARRHDSAHHVRVRRVGQPERGGRLPLHARLLALRQRRRSGLPAAARHHRPARLAGAVLGARQVGGPDAGAAHERRAAAAQDQHGGRPRRRERTLSPLRGGGVRVRMAARPRRPDHTVTPRTRARAGGTARAPIFRFSVPIGASGQPTGCSQAHHEQQQCEQQGDREKHHQGPDHRRSERFHRAIQLTRTICSPFTPRRLPYLEEILRPEQCKPF